MQPWDFLDVQEKVMKKHIGVQEYLSARLNPQLAKLTFNRQVELRLRAKIQRLDDQLWYRLVILLGSPLADDFE